MALTDKLSAIGNAIRSKTGTSELLTLDAMPTAIEGIETGGGGDTSIEDGLITGTLTEYTNDRVESIARYAFYYKRITKVSMANCKQVGQNVFQGCEKLESASFPLATKLDAYAFHGCKALVTISAPNCETLNRNVFENCSSLVSVAFPKIKQCYASYGFKNCKALKTADFGVNCSNIYDYMFVGCSSLDTLIIRRNEVCPMYHTALFNSTPFASGGTGGTVYVPAALIEQYQNETNWSTLYAAGTCTFLPIEGSEYE